MKKQYSLLSITALAISAIAFTLFYKSPSYVPRKAAVGQSQVPMPLSWAKVDLRTGEYNSAARIEVLNQISRRANRAEAIGMDWQSKGPDNVGGRTRAIIELYGEPNTLFAGSTSGGLFVSYNGGGNWEPHLQFQNIETSSSIIASIHQDTISDNIYVGTGSSFDGLANVAQIEWPGHGIYVSTDNGETFEHLSSTTPDSRFTTAGNPWLAVNRIRTDVDGNIYAATEMGLKKSSDEGETWEDVVFIDANGTIPSSVSYADVATASNGAVVASTASGVVYISPDGSAGSFEQVKGLPTNARRTVLGIAPSNPEHIYVMYIDGNACFESVYESTDGGESWEKILIPHDDFTPMVQGDVCSGSNTGQGVYDACMAVSPLNEDMIFIGGIELWRYDGNLTRVSNEFGQPPFSDVLPNYVHSDKHEIYFSPNDGKRMYVTSDGGITRTENNGLTFQGLNKGYTTTQFFSVAHSVINGLIMGGAQDNGTLVVLNDVPSDPFIGYEVFGNDGIDCDMSQISSILFATSQEGLVVRVDAGQRNGSSFPVGFISEMNSGGPFHTVVKLWEKEGDLTSRDSVVFTVAPAEISIGVSNGAVRTYAETHYPIQPAAIIDLNSVTIYSGDQLLTVADNEGNVEGDGTGTVSLNSDGSLNIDITFDEAPTENSNVYVGYELRFEANSVLILESENLNSGLQAYEFEHRLEFDLNTGDQIKVQDPIQSLLASTGEGGFNGLRIYRNVLNFFDTPTPIDITGLSGTVTAVEFSSDGNHAFVGTTGGTLTRISGLQQLYTADDVDDLEITILSGAAMSGGGITGIAIDPTDDNRLVVTGGGYGLTNRVKITTDALDNAPSFTVIHGDLPAFPVYDAEINVNDPAVVIIGTEFGLWATTDANAGTATTWSDENTEISYVPCYDVRQQKLPWNKADNHGIFYVGSHGRGFWESTKLVGVNEWPKANGVEEFSGLTVFPNPMSYQGTIEFESAAEALTTINVYNSQGRLVKSFNHRAVSGNNRVDFNVGNLASGHYFATVGSGNSAQVAKFMVAGKL